MSAPTAKKQVDIVQTFPFPVEKLFAFLSDHENLQAIFPLKIRRVRDGQDSINGVGSTRRMTAPGGLVSLEETNTRVEPNSVIEYTISKGGWPIRNHYGIMRFYPFEQGSRLHYSIHFDTAIPGAAALVAKGLELPIRAGLKKLAKRGL